MTNKKKLVIVESPTKAKTIAKLLGEEFNSIATVGHFRDLSKKDLGIEIKETEDNGTTRYEFIPKYELSTSKDVQKVKKELRKNIQKIED